MRVVSFPSSTDKSPSCSFVLEELKLELSQHQFGWEQKQKIYSILSYMSSIDSAKAKSDLATTWFYAMYSTLRSDMITSMHICLADLNLYLMFRMCDLTPTWQARNVAVFSFSAIDIGLDIDPCTLKSRYASLIMRLAF